MKGHFLRGDEVSLRALEPEDTDLMWRIENDSTQWMANGMSAPYSRHNLREYALTYDADPISARQLRLVIEYRKMPVGLADLYDISPLNRTAFIGIYILPEMRHNGIGESAVDLLCEYARDILHLRVLGAKISETNIESIHLFESCSFTKCGALPDWIETPHGAKDMLLYSRACAIEK